MKHLNINWHTLISILLIIACIFALYVLNSYVLTMTHGYYNIFRILFM